MYERSVSHEESTIRSLSRDPEFAAEYINSVFEDGSQEEIMTALRRVSEAYGGVSRLASLTGLNSNTLYRTLSPSGNPELKSLLAILSALGFELSVTPKRAKQTSDIGQIPAHV